MLKTFLSISEVKFSALIIGLLMSLGFGLYIAYVRGDIPDNLTTIITTLILTIGGVNAIHGATSLMSGKGASDPPQTPTVPGAAKFSVTADEPGKTGGKTGLAADEVEGAAWSGLEADVPIPGPNSTAPNAQAAGPNPMTFKK